MLHLHSKSLLCQTKNITIMCNINENFCEFTDVDFDCCMQEDKIVNEDIIFAMRWVISVMSEDLESGRITLHCLSMLAEMRDRYNELSELYEHSQK